MKTNKEFINGIYEKFDEYTNEKQAKKQKNIKKIVNIAAVIIVLLSSIIVFTGSNNPKTTIIKDGKIEENQISLETIGTFENFYEIIKNKYAVNGNLGLNVENSVVQDLEKSYDATAEEKRSETNTQVKNVDEADVVKVDDRYIYYISEKKVVIIDAEKPENSEKIAEVNYNQENFNPREIYVKDKKLIVIGNEYDDLCKTESTSVEDIAINDVARIASNKSKSGIIIYDVTNIKEPKEIRRVMIEGTYISSRMIENNIYFVANKNIYSSSLLRNPIEDLYQNEYKPRYIDTAVEQEEKCIDYSQIYYLDGTNDASYLMLVGLNLSSSEEAEIRTFLGAGEYIYMRQKEICILL